MTLNKETIAQMMLFTGMLAFGLLMRVVLTSYKPAKAILSATATASQRFAISVGLFAVGYAIGFLIEYIISKRNTLTIIEIS